MATAPSTLPKPACLSIEVGGQHRRVDVTAVPFSIGRSEDCNASIPDVRVSRRHAQIVQEDGHLVIVDSGSRHGTFVNGVRCDRATLISRDEITLGVPGVRILFLDESQSQNLSSAYLTRLASSSDVSELEKLRLFLEAARSLNSGLVLQDVLRNMLEYALRLTKAERGFIYLRDKSQTPALTCGLNSQGASLLDDADVSRSVINDAIHSASEFISGDVSQQSMFSARQSIMLHELRTIVAIPLRRKRVGDDASTEAEGVLYLDSRMASRTLSGVAPDVLRALAGECAAVLESARLMEAEQSAQRHQQEMEIAASIQRSLGSDADLQCEFARVTGRSIPSREVGGDFFEVHTSPEAVTAILADVSGKGISAALLASVIQGMYYAQITAGASLVDVAASINRFLCLRVAGQKYATMVIAQVDRSGLLRIVNCGHVPLLVAVNGNCARVEDGDLPVGLMPDAAFRILEQQLAPGTRVCLMSDGISEAENSAGAEFGISAVEELLCSGSDVHAILAAVNSFTGNSDLQDDRTVVTIDYTGATV
jgi:serine phosphatase RsbU (regulator of sigma subunit)